MNNLKQELLDILACPKCKTAIIQNNDRIICTNPNCGLSYPIRNGIPVMLVEEATAPLTKNNKDI